MDSGSAAVRLLSASGAPVGFGVSGNAVRYAYTSREDAFPDVDPGIRPFGCMVLVQLRQPMRKTGGGILLTDEDKKTEHYNTQVALVRAIGPVAFHNRNDGKPWPEGAWAHVGDFVRVPKYQGDRFMVPFARTERERDPETGKDEPVTRTEECIFTLFKDLQLLGLYTDDPLAIRSFY